MRPVTHRRKKGPREGRMVACTLLTRYFALLRPESGLKDTVALNVGDEVEIAVRFPEYKGRYLFHCHNLEHEDRGMMARFDVQ